MMKLLIPFSIFAGDLPATQQQRGKMYCSYCNNEIKSDAVSESGRIFCNSLCRHLFLKQNNGNAGPAAQHQPIISEDHNLSNGVFLDNLDFNLNLEGFEGRNLILRCSYFRGPRLFIDGRKLKLFKRQIFRRKRHYIIKNNQGTDCHITLKLKSLDGIPRFWVNQKEVILAQKLKWYDYTFIGAPLVLYAPLFGWLGGFFGGMATFTNSMVFRKVRNKPARYVIASANFVFAFLLIWQSLIFITPYIQQLELNMSKGEISQSELKGTRYEAISSQVWRFEKCVDKEGNPVQSPQNEITGANLSFNGDGSTMIVPDNNVAYTGKWSLDPASGSLDILIGTEKLSFRVISVSEKELEMEIDTRIFKFKSV